MAFQKEILASCPSCKQPMLKVIESRKTKESTRRRKECQNCKYRVTTHEVSAKFFQQAKNNAWLVWDILRLVHQNHPSPVLQFTSAEATCKCNDCNYNINGKRCNFDFPEYDTDDSFDCNHYEQKKEAA